ncbi:MAG: YsnF/AvaK domain-containing protein [Myxococcota bacterium]|nr:YsnF/AvaK domain-containing protein [Myxococcota bacterium]
MKTVIAAFADRTVADTAASRLRMLGMLRGRHIPDERAHQYAEVVRRGAALIVVEADDDEAAQIAAELDDLGSIDLEAASTRWQASGWQGYDERGGMLDDDQRQLERQHLDRESIAVVQEDVQIGKRQVQREGVRVRTFITERPVHEQVELREEHINVTRERVDEPVPVEGVDATFSEDEFVVTASGEEAVVGKQARVVERVRVEKEQDTRTETIEETERRRDVEVEPIEPHVRGPGR